MVHILFLNVENLVIKFISLNLFIYGTHIALKCREFGIKMYIKASMYLLKLTTRMRDLVSFWTKKVEINC